jgi:CheY-like chemotaxis protein
MVVDDNVDAADSLALLLRSLGHEACVTYDGIAAIQMAEEFRPDIVLLDLGMPGIDGYETARRLRNLKRQFRIVAVTGWGQDAERKKSRDAGFDLHLVKPVNEETLSEAIVNEGSEGKKTIH